jgi:tetratricopeptide (TPR) repeat protein
VAYERFLDAREAGRPEAELLHHLNAAADSCYQALELLPPDAVNDLAVTHNQLGNIYLGAGGLDRAVHHYRESIRYMESAGNLYGAAQTRFNVAVTLAQAGRLPDALAFALEARRNFETYDDRAAAKIRKTQELIDLIEREMGER